MIRTALLRRASDNGRLSKITAIADVVNRLGIATTIIAVGLALVVAVAFGKIENPLASSTQLKNHDEKQAISHAVLKCRQEQDSKEREACFNDIGKQEKEE